MNKSSIKHKILVRIRESRIRGQSEGGRLDT